MDFFKTFKVACFVVLCIELLTVLNLDVMSCLKISEKMLCNQSEIRIKQIIGSDHIIFSKCDLTLDQVLTK